ncbi:MAG: hypothetical protein BWX98_02592 [Candidatus Aminicenantes bacterium ADurb.Bin147]|nr:MAG: hypothetical protein BWX98_02592 [Candidatus Aminicenantes bacterium ADurb.Bin147]
MLLIGLAPMASIFFRRLSGEGPTDKPLTTNPVYREQRSSSKTSTSTSSDVAAGSSTTGWRRSLRGEPVMVEISRAIPRWPRVSGRLA